MELSTSVRRALAEAGWTPERRVDPEAWTRLLRREGYEFPPAAERILESFGGLFVEEARDSFHFDPVDAAGGELDRFEEWEAIVGRKLAPVGGTGLWILCADDEGQLYIGSHGSVDVLGPFAQALEYLCTGEPEPRVLFP